MHSECKAQALQCAVLRQNVVLRFPSDSSVLNLELRCLSTNLSDGIRNGQFHMSASSVQNRHVVGAMGVVATVARVAR